MWFGPLGIQQLSLLETLILLIRAYRTRILDAPTGVLAAMFVGTSQAWMSILERNLVTPFSRERHVLTSCVVSVS